MLVSQLISSMHNKQYGLQAVWIANSTHRESLLACVANTPNVHCTATHAIAAF